MAVGSASAEVAACPVEDYRFEVHRRPIISNDLQKLVEKACAKPMAFDGRERQIVSLAFGNVRLENERVTKLAVSEAQDKLKR